MPLEDKLQQLALAPTTSGETTWQPSTTPLETILERLIRTFVLFPRIIDSLGLHDVFHLSQTCKLFRILTEKYRPWPATWEKLTLSDKFTFRTGLGSVRPWLWFCIGCGGLHPVNLSDTPSKPSVDCDSADVDWCPQPPTTINMSRPRVHHNHVLLTLKYARLPALGSVYGEYLNRLLAPFGYETDAIPGISHSYWAKPKILNGQYIFYEQRSYTPNSKEPGSGGCCVKKETFDHPMFNFKICSHMAIDNGGLPQMRVLYEAGHLKNRDNRLHLTVDECIMSTVVRIKSFACRHCLTDCEVALEPDGNGSIRLYVRSWKDFGGDDGLPTFTEWLAQIDRNPDRHVGRLYWLSHEPGSIRRLWEDNHDKFEEEPTWSPGVVAPAA